MSCYCSASHTDNNYSTDEHDSVRDSINRASTTTTTTQSLTHKLGLHQSDSGADLSEYQQDQHEARSIQSLVASYDKSFSSPTSRCDNGLELVSDNNGIDGDNLALIDGKNKKTNDTQAQRGRGHLADSNSKHRKADDDGVKLKELNLANEKVSSMHYYQMYSHDKSSLDIAWDKFWSDNGEQMIWSSWIGKYADYINPAYLQAYHQSTCDVVEREDAELKRNPSVEKYAEQNTCFPSEAHKNCELNLSNFEGIFKKNENVNFPFDTTNRPEVNDRDAAENRKAVAQQEIQQDVSEGWNPLSPFSPEDSGSNQQSYGEDERLIARCDSMNGSLTAKTYATQSDSMTNVTKMTLTSSSCDSNSIQSSLVSSATSSIESNATTSNSSDQENEFNAEESDRYWQHLWKENFEDQYQNQYKLFAER